ncbi:MAG TPA: FAD-dependent oxidoreductase [Dehalococcoidales bacterium]
MRPETQTPAKEMEASLVVIGGGGAGLASALAAAEKGVTGIVVLEKRGALGGNTALATGLFACESPAQARDKIVADRDELFKRAMNWAHWSRVNPRILRIFFNKSGDTIRWLEEKGLQFNVITFFPNQNPRVEHVAKGKGAEVIQVLAKNSRSSGVQILSSCAATRILFDAENKLAGVRATMGSETLKIETQTIIIATGGFGANEILLKKLCPLYYEGMPMRGLPLTGDGLILASEAGAATEDFVTLLKEGPRIDLNIWPLGGLEREPQTMWVNRRGQRFTDEAIGIHPFEAVNPMIAQPDGVTYTLLDDRIKQGFAAKKSGLDEALQKEVAKNRVKISNSWDEIATWIGASIPALKESIEEYNAGCERGYDNLFAKERRYLESVLTPPFYAIRCLPHFLDTLGGIKINERMEVLNQDSAPIAGLYAAGVITSGWESETYCSDLSGSAFGYAINSGRIAGENAAHRILGKDEIQSQS